VKLKFGRYLLAAILLAQPLAAQELDLTGFYTARTTILGSDNDIFTLNTGLTWSKGATGTRRATGTRLVLNTGVRNEYWSGSFPPLSGVEILRFSTNANTRRGVAARLEWAADRSTTNELIYGWEQFDADSTLRLALGLQSVVQISAVQGRYALAGFGIAEKSWYLNDNLALRAGAQIDDGGLLLAAQGEMKLGRWPVSFLMEWTYAATSYRDEPGYNDLTGALVYVREFGTLKSRDRRLPLRLTHRYAAVQ